MSPPHGYEIEGNIRAFASKDVSGAEQFICARAHGVESGTALADVNTARCRASSGVEGGSKRLSGWQLMEIWDRLCVMLRARGVSVEDVSNKARLRPPAPLTTLPCGKSLSCWH